MSDCIFCKIVAKEIPSQFIFENDTVIAFLDINPNNPGHSLIVPKEHHHDLLHTPDNILSEMITHVKSIAPAITSAVNADGFNTIINTEPASGQVIFHTHIHIIPRFKDDGLKHWPGKDIPKEEMTAIQEKIKANLQ